MSFENLRGGDLIKFRLRDKELMAKVQHLLVFPSHVVVNLGGRYGTPAVVDANNFIKLVRRA